MRNLISTLLQNFIFLKTIVCVIKFNLVKIFNFWNINAKKNKFFKTKKKLVI